MRGGCPVRGGWQEGSSSITDQQEGPQGPQNKSDNRLISDRCPPAISLPLPSALHCHRPIIRNRMATAWAWDKDCWHGPGAWPWPDNNLVIPATCSCMMCTKGWGLSSKKDAIMSLKSGSDARLLHLPPRPAQTLHLMKTLAEVGWLWPSFSWVPLLGFFWGMLCKNYVTFYIPLGFRGLADGGIWHGWLPSGGINTSSNQSCWQPAIWLPPPCGRPDVAQFHLPPDCHHIHLWPPKK